MAYIDARDAAELLNQYATYGWERDYYSVNGNTYCRVGVVLPDGKVINKMRAKDNKPIIARRQAAVFPFPGGCLSARPDAMRERKQS